MKSVEIEVDVIQDTSTPYTPDSIFPNNWFSSHTNVMMGVTENFVVVCLESISNLKERDALKNSILNSKKEIIDISLNQVLKFCGNVLELKNSHGKRYTLMSKSAFEVFTKEQIDVIKKSSATL